MAFQFCFFLAIPRPKLQLADTCFPILLSILLRLLFLVCNGITDVSSLWGEWCYGGCFFFFLGGNGIMMMR